MLEIVVLVYRSTNTIAVMEKMFFELLYTRPGFSWVNPGDEWQLPENIDQLYCPLTKQLYISDIGGNQVIW